MSALTSMGRSMCSPMADNPSGGRMSHCCGCEADAFPGDKDDAAPTGCPPP